MIFIFTAILSRFKTNNSLHVLMIFEKVMDNLYIFCRYSSTLNGLRLEEKQKNNTYYF